MYIFTTLFSSPNFRMKIHTSTYTHTLNLCKSINVFKHLNRLDNNSQYLLMIWFKADLTYGTYLVFCTTDWI